MHTCKYEEVFARENGRKREKCMVQQLGGGVFYFDSTTSGMQHGNQLSLRLAGAYRVYLRRAIGGPLPNLLLMCSVS